MQLETRRDFRKSVLQLEETLKADEVQHEIALANCELQHTVAPGVYIRNIKIKAGTLVVGKLHKTKHANIISQGYCFERTEFGEPQVHDAIHAPVHFVSEVGTKRIVYAVIDTYWSTIHPTELEDPELIESEVIAPSYDELIKYFPSLSLDRLEV